MENTIDPTPKKQQKKSFGAIAMNVFRAIGRGLTNETFLYILKRTLTAIITLILLIAVVTALIRLLPDTKFYNYSTYRKIKGQSGEEVANNWRNSILYQFGRVDLNGNRVSVLQSIFQYIYWVLPIPKRVPIVWDRYYEHPIKYWEGFTYFGRSIQYTKFITDLLGERMGISMFMSLITVAGTYILAIPLGIAMAKKPGGVVDKIGNVFIVLNYAIPGLVFYLVMNRVFGLKTGIFGALNLGLIYDQSKPQTMIPPLFCMIFLAIPGVSIWVRRFMIDELTSDYVKFARSKGLSETTIMYKHVFRNAMIPLVRNIPGTLLGAFIGSYYVESIWLIPGTGNLLINSLSGAPDVPVVQGLTVIYAGISMLSFLLGDIITVFFDPRIKLQAD